MKVAQKEYLFYVSCGVISQRENIQLILNITDSMSHIYMYNYIS